MRVVCDNCGATYKIPDRKLIKEVNKATCRKCGHRMLIRRDGPAANPQDEASAHDSFRKAAAAAAAAARVPRPAAPPGSEWEEEDPTLIAKLDEHGEPQIPRRPGATRRTAAPVAASPVAATPVAATPPQVPAVPAPVAATPVAASPVAASPVAASPVAASPVAASPVAASPVAATPSSAGAVPIMRPPGLSAVPDTVRPGVSAPPTAPAFNPTGDLSFIGVGVFMAAIGSLLLSVNVSGNALLRFVGLFMALWGTLTALFIVVTGSRGQRKASVFLSTTLGTIFAVGGAAAIGLVTSGMQVLDTVGTELVHSAEQPTLRTTPSTRVDQRIDALFADDDGATADASDNTATVDAAAPETLADVASEGLDATMAEAAGPEAAGPAPSSSRTSTSTTTRSTSTATYVAPPAEPVRTTRTPSSSRLSSSGSSSSRLSSSGSSSSRLSSSGSSSSRSSSSRSSGSRSSSSSPSSSIPSSSSPSSSRSSSSGSSSGMTTLPPTVVDTMVKSNKDVKKCMFHEYKRAGGQLSSVTIRFKVLSSGKVSSAYVTSSHYKDSELDSCLSSAMYGVVFPTFDGDALTLDVTLGA